MKLQKVLLYIVYVLLGISATAILLSCGFEIAGKTAISDTFVVIFSIGGTLALIILIARLFIMVNSAPTFINEPPKKKVIKVVNVKPIVKTKEEKLFEQYQDLYKKKLITKEDLENKRKELLGNKK